ncbi:uncharacterized protein LOC122650947 [Telopea speciosissima]|uniref:uncharacterized protein LOC122650947 n=1 Tax=Telopea speciosissima TaxID=54955 RepID=UPI001CC39602|nr:uncharacterized protein LOC122650947 [Telopea speciosissima]
MDYVDNALQIDSSLRVKDILGGDSTWNNAVIDQIDVDEVRQGILQGTHLISGEPDRLVWNELRLRSPECGYSRWIWNRTLPTEIGFFTWQIFNGAVPTDESVKVGIPLVSKCNYCRSPRCESTDHCLAFGGTASRVWSFFLRVFDVPDEVSLDVKSRILLWRESASCNSQAAFIAGLLPSLIVWEIWKERCNKRHGERRRSARGVIGSIMAWVTCLPMPSNLGNRYSLMEQHILAIFGMAAPPSRIARPIPVY